MTNDILSGYRLHWLLIFELLFLPCILPQNRRCWWRLPPAIGPELESFTVNINGVHSERWSWSIVRLSRHDDAGISLIPRLWTVAWVWPWVAALIKLCYYAWRMWNINLIITITWWIGEAAGGGGWAAFRLLYTLHKTLLWTTARDTQRISSRITARDLKSIHFDNFHLLILLAQFLNYCS